MVYEPSLEFEGCSANESQQLTRIETLRAGRVVDVIAPVVGNSEVLNQQNSVTLLSLCFHPLVLKCICARTVYTISGTTLLMRPGNQIINFSINITILVAVLKAIGEYINGWMVFTV